MPVYILKWKMDFLNLIYVEIIAQIKIWSVQNKQHYNL